MQASFAHLDNDDDGGLRLASQSQGTFETPLRRSRADSANSIRHALCGRQPLPTNVLSHAKPSSQSLLSIVKAPSSLVQDTALNWESQGEESGVWKEARTEMSMEEIVDFVQGVNTRAKVIQKRRAIKRAKGDKNTTHNMAGVGSDCHHSHPSFSVLRQCFVSHWSACDDVGLCILGIQGILR